MNQSLAERKAAIRQAGLAARQAQVDKASVSQRITNAVMALPQYQAAHRVMWYIDVRDEVRTRLALTDALASDKGIVIPYCVEGELELFLLESMEELATGMYQILEPKAGLRHVESKKVIIQDIDLVLVPGVAFDAHGSRLGHGNGYYDKCLASVRAETPLVALAFQCQMFDEIPMQDHDICMDKIVTEANVYQCNGRG
jgi:5-formyltetrahydrofolate cyclo-ligase